MCIYRYISIGIYIYFSIYVYLDVGTDTDTLDAVEAHAGSPIQACLERYTCGRLLKCMLFLRPPFWLDLGSSHLRWPVLY